MIFMASTKINEHKTATEIMQLLSKYGVSDIRMQYDNGKIIGLQFAIEYNTTKIPFKMPIKFEGVLDSMSNDKQTPRSLCNIEQASRVAWRQILRWLQAQMALIEVNMVDIKEVFMPYIMISKEQTLYEKLEQEKFMQIEYKP